MPVSPCSSFANLSRLFLYISNSQDLDSVCQALEKPTFLNCDPVSIHSLGKNCPVLLKNNVIGAYAAFFQGLCT